MIAITTNRIAHLGDHSSGSVADAIKDYCHWLQSNGRAESTARHEKRLLETVLVEVMGCECLEHFDEAATVGFCENQETNGYASRSIENHLYSLKRFSKWLFENGRIDQDQIASLSWQIDESEFNDRAQVRFVRLFKLIEVASGYRFGATFEVLYDDINAVCPSSDRTIRRDLKLLTSLGILRKQRNESLGLLVWVANPLSQIQQLLAAAG